LQITIRGLLGCALVLVIGSGCMVGSDDEDRDVIVFEDGTAAEHAKELASELAEQQSGDTAYCNDRTVPSDWCVLECTSCACSSCCVQRHDNSIHCGTWWEGGGY
jgi:hypothetical protein